MNPSYFEFDPYPWSPHNTDVNADASMFDFDRRHAAWKTTADWRVRPDPGPGLWTRKDGITMKIRDMESSHIVNTIAYIWRSTTMSRHGIPGPGMAIPADHARRKIDEMMSVLRARVAQ